MGLIERFKDFYSDKSEYQTSEKTPEPGTRPDAYSTEQQNASQDVEPEPGDDNVVDSTRKTAESFFSDSVSGDSPVTFGLIVLVGFGIYAFVNLVLVIIKFFS
jgi:hypothetical protein